MEINLKDAKTSAQAVTKICYNEATRNLNFKVECDDLKDLMECVKIINSYNQFDWETVNEALYKYVNFKVFYQEGNPNNGGDLFKFSIGRESSPVVYIFYFKGDKYFDEIGELSFTKEGFTGLMELLKKAAKADECDVYEDGFFYVARLWWD